MPVPGDRQVWHLQTLIDEKFRPENYSGGGFDFSRTMRLLSISLECAVPFHYLELDALSAFLSDSEFWDEIQRVARLCSQLVAEKGDLLMFRGKKRGQSAEVFNALSRGIACLSYAPGGVRIFGLHFQRKRVWIRPDGGVRERPEEGKGTGEE